MSGISPCTILLILYIPVIVRLIISSYITILASRSFIPNSLVPFYRLKNKRRFLISVEVIATYSNNFTLRRAILLVSSSL